jgi:signal transduction histidine kinase
VALWTSVIFAAITLGFAPFAAPLWPNIPAFVPAYGAVTATCYILSAYILLADFRMSGEASLLVLAGGSIYTAGTLLLQLTSTPAIFGPDRLIGGPQSTIWLWTFWHLGPPLYGLLYAAFEWRWPAYAVPKHRRWQAILIGVAVTVIILSVLAVTVTLLHDFLPIQNQGRDYSLIVRTGTAPLVTLLNVAAAVVVWRVTRTQTVLQLWLVTSLVMLICDNFVTMIGGVRDSIGWYVGRLEALASASVILIIYLHEIGAIAGRLSTTAAQLLETHRLLRAETEQRLAAEERVRQTQKLEAIAQLTAGVAHGFNNLLTGLLGNIELAQSAIGEEKRNRLLQRAIGSVERGAQLTSQLLAFARRQHLVTSVADINALIVSLRELLERRAGPGVRIEARLAPIVWPVVIDRYAFEMALLNVVLNARDAMPDGGMLTIETENIVANSPDLPSDLAKGEYVGIYVSDTGTGMPEDIANTAFDPFFTTKDVGEGSGLGLSMVYGFVKQLGGSARLTSEPHRGTRVCLFLPRSFDEITASQEESPHREAAD